jgi:hypothetical protein
MGAYEDAFPYLEHFLGGWMNQDFAVLSGGSVESAVADFVSTSRADEAHALRMDIERFLVFKDYDVDGEFRRLFPASVIPTAWHMSTRDWLLWIERLVGEGLKRGA